MVPYHFMSKQCNIKIHVTWSSFCKKLPRSRKKSQNWLTVAFGTSKKWLSRANYIYAKIKFDAFLKLKMTSNLHIGGFWWCSFHYWCQNYCILLGNTWSGDMVTKIIWIQHIIMKITWRYKQHTMYTGVTQCLIATQLP